MIYSRILQVNQAWVRAGDRLLAVFKSRRASAQYGPVNFVNRCTKAFQFDAQRMSAFGGKADMPFCTAHVRL